MRNPLIGLASGVWSSLSQGVRLSAQAGILKSVRLDVRVISVGNIQVGGAGKTPLVAQIANEAIQRGIEVCILTRGYKSEWESTGGVLLPEDPALDPALCGDEAALLHDLSPRAFIGVGADRVRQYGRVQEKARGRIGLVILDDGFQHWKIRKDVEVVAVTSAQPWKVLFRDFPKALKRADLVIWTKGDELPSSIDRSDVRVCYQLPHFFGTEPFWLITGVGDGASVHALVNQFGYRISKHIQYSDHIGYKKDQVQKLLKDAAAEQVKILLTGKDWVKWRALGVSQKDVNVVEPRLIFKEGHANWSRILWGE